MSRNMAPVHLDADVVSEVLRDDWGTLVSSLEKGFKSMSAGKVIQPVRLCIEVKKHKGELDLMPAYDMDNDLLGIKLLTVYPKNKDKGLPRLHSLALLYDVTDGTLKATMDAEVITNMRTAAASLVATKYLTCKDPKCVAILGSGNQARSHYKATKRLLNIQKFRVWNKNEPTGMKLVEEIREQGSDCEFCKDVKSAVEGADIIHVCTLATTPILMKEWVKEGAHINGVGAASAEAQELDPELVNSSVVYVENKESALKEAGDIIIAKAEIYAEIGEVIAGHKEAFPQKTTIFKSVGVAMEDLVAVNLAYQNYMKLNKK